MAQVTPYNFKRAIGFSKENISILNKIHENFSSSFETFFSNKLRTRIEADIIGIKQVPFREYYPTLGRNSVRSLINIAPLEGKMLIQVSGNIVFTVLDRMLGGPGKNIRNSAQLTDIEQFVMKQVLYNMLDQWKEAWDPVIGFVIGREDIEVNPRNLMVISQNETIIVTTFKLMVGRESGEMEICLPYNTLQPVTPKLSATQLFSPKRIMRDRDEIEVLEKRVKKTVLELSAVLGHSVISIEEFLRLEIGDIIRLNETTDDPVVVKVNENAKFLGQPGLHRGKLAIQIMETLEEG